MSKLNASVLLAEILRLQRWAGGESISSARIFGLLNGFESIINEETECFGVSSKTQTAVEDILADIEEGTQSAVGLDVKDRLRADEIDETDFRRVVELCRLESRFLEAIDALSSTMLALEERSPEQDWFGSLHYVELHLESGGIGKAHSVFSATVPRVGELISATSESSEPISMKVVEVSYVLSDSEDGAQILIPHVFATDKE